MSTGRPILNQTVLLSKRDLLNKGLHCIGIPGIDSTKRCCLLANAINLSHPKIDEILSKKPPRLENADLTWFAIVLIVLSVFLLQTKYTK